MYLYNHCNLETNSQLVLVMFFCQSRPKLPPRLRKHCLSVYLMYICVISFVYFVCLLFPCAPQESLPNQIVEFTRESAEVTRLDPDAHGLLSVPSGTAKAWVDPAFTRLPLYWNMPKSVLGDKVIVSFVTDQVSHPRGVW